MNLEKIFDLYCHMNTDSTRESDYQVGDVLLTPNQQKRVLLKSVQNFIHTNGYENKGKIIQAFTGSADLPVLTKDVFNTTNQVNNFDLLWQEAFRGISLRKGQLSWEINTVASDAIFLEVPEGGKVRFERYKGEKLIAEIAKYGMGIGITWETREGRKLYQFIQQMEQVRSKLFELWANVHYGLLATAGALNPITYQLTASEGQLERDIATINKGYEDLGEANKDKGYGDTANARMLLYHSPKLKARIMQALRATSRDTIASGRTESGRIVEYNVEPRATWNASIPANKALLVLPGNKIQNSVYLRQLELNKQDMESLNELRTYWTAFGAVVADSDQVYELSFA